MAARKLAQEVDKCFKKVAEGIAEFDAIYEKIEQSTNQAQKEKLEDNLKREIKKLQRLRDQIKTWAASNDIKVKAPLLEQRKNIETCMERFKAVEKAMKTKAYSKEGLSAAAKLDPKEQAKLEAGEFLSGMIDELEQQVEALEAEEEQIQATMKKKKAGAQADRIQEIDRVIERHKWHQAKLELIRRALENGGLETEQVTDLEESIRYYVSDNQNDDFMEDEELYDELNLEEEEDAYGILPENDRSSSQDNQSVQEDIPEPESRPSSIPGKTKAAVEATVSTGRRPSAQLKSPLPTLATLHTPPASTPNGSATSVGAMKAAPLPTRPPGEGLKYASAAAAAAASDKLNLGISPLPPPPGSQPTTSGMSPMPAAQAAKTSATSSPAMTSIQPATSDAKPIAPRPTDTKVTDEPTTRSVTPAPSSRKAEKAISKPIKAPAATEPTEPSKASQPNGFTNGTKTTQAAGEEQEEDSVFHLPSSLQDLMDSFEVTKKRPVPAVNAPSYLRMMQSSQANTPDITDAEGPKKYRPEARFNSVANYPTDPLAIFDDPRLYSRIDPDTLFYVFYYKQGTYQQYLAAKALKDQSWRFHKQYQTWFQRHEEPKSITEEFEQGTYRFFDYESTWMNRRKADFKFAYRFLEDDV